ncbi:tyrosine-protein phosphatase Lar-like [Haliotis rufescens]|uniref:tyrosine-protein phosphatase Lar-like n=1 Tax=Haliotis rufescens TaxID=6454 RepID=UPI00201F9E75|nr:tyrosine-protein phosphatase Lar-like [Haliotis rufescens]
MAVLLNWLFVVTFIPVLASSQSTTNNGNTNIQRSTGGNITTETPTTGNTDVTISSTFVTTTEPIVAGLVAFMLILTIAIITACAIFVKRTKSSKGMHSKVVVSSKCCIVRNPTSFTAKLPTISFANVVVQLHGESARVNDIGRVAEETTHDDAEKGEAQNVPAQPEPIICTSITTAALEEHVAQVTQTETRFKSEYESLPAGFTNTFDESRVFMNKGKNRYMSYYPYDYNRVALSFLPGDPSSTYINASYINGFKTDMAYIAAQAPKERTLKDFWRMIWEKKCGKIVMLTHLVEKGKDKCEQYWSMKRPFVIGDLTITVARRDTRSHYIIREFSVTERHTEESRIVTQFHFVAWPDHSVPEVTSLLNFIWHVRKAPTCQDGPLLVHCSAGIGRTGTYITLDYHLDKIQTDDEVDIFDFVCKLRDQRKGMIQTKEQYECVYSSLVEAVAMGDQGLPCQQFLERRQIAQTFNLGSCSIVELLQIMRAKRDKQDPNAELPGRLVINGQLDHFAFILQSHMSRYGYVVSQTPCSRNMEGFWSLIRDINCSVVVLFPGATKDIERMCPSSTNQCLECGSLCLTYIGETNLTEATNMLNIAVNVREQVTSQAKDIHVVCVSKSESPSLTSLPDLVEVVDSAQEGNSEKLVTVVFGEGDRKFAAMLCVIRNIFQGMIHDNEVDIFNNINRVAHILHDEDLTEVDVASLYDIVDMKLASPDTYVNVSNTANITASNTASITASNTASITASNKEEGDVYVNL